MKRIIMVLGFFLMLQSLQAQTALEIINKAEEFIKGTTSYGIFTMEVFRPDYSRKVKMESWNDEYDRALIVTLEPKKEAGNKMLKIDKEIWSYLKNTERTIKLPASMMLQSWNGSDLTNDDLVRESKLIDDYDLRLMFEEKIAGEMCWKIELTPKPDAPVVWGKLYYWVRQSDYLPALVQYYDERGRKHRTMKFRDYRVMDDRKIPLVWIIENNRKDGHYTVFKYNDVKFNVDIPNRIFSKRELER